VGKERQRPGGKEVGKTESGRQLSVSYPCLKCEGGLGHRGKRELRRQRQEEGNWKRGDGHQEKESGKGRREIRRKEVGKGRQRPGGKKVGKGRRRPGERKWERGRQRPGGKEVGKTESVRQLSVSYPCLKWVGGVGHRGKRELRRQRQEEGNWKGSRKGGTETRRKGSGKDRKRQTAQCLLPLSEVGGRRGTDCCQNNCQHLMPGSLLRISLQVFHNSLLYSTMYNSREYKDAGNALYILWSLLYSSPYPVLP
jgi:hypothetical protein